MTGVAVVLQLPPPVVEIATFGAEPRFALLDAFAGLIKVILAGAAPVHPPLAVGVQPVKFVLGGVECRSVRTSHEVALAAAFVNREIRGEAFHDAESEKGVHTGAQRLGRGGGVCQRLDLFAVEEHQPSDPDGDELIDGFRPVVGERTVRVVVPEDFDRFLEFPNSGAPVASDPVPVFGTVPPMAKGKLKGGAFRGPHRPMDETPQVAVVAGSVAVETRSAPTEEHQLHCVQKSCLPRAVQPADHHQGLLPRGRGERQDVPPAKDAEILENEFVENHDWTCRATVRLRIGKVWRTRAVRPSRGPPDPARRPQLPFVCVRSPSRRRRRRSNHAAPSRRSPSKSPLLRSWVRCCHSNDRRLRVSS